MRVGASVSHVDGDELLEYVVDEIEHGILLVLVYKLLAGFFGSKQIEAERQCFRNHDEEIYHCSYCCSMEQSAVKEV